MHEKYKIYSKHPNSDSTIGVKHPIAENSKINRRSNREENTQTIDDSVGDIEPPSKHKKSFANQNISREVKYIGRKIEEQTNIGYNKENLYLKTIENYTPLDENTVYIELSSFYEPKYVIPQNFDISDEVYTPYVPPVNITSFIRYSEEIDEFIEQSKSLSMAA